MHKRKIGVYAAYRLERWIVIEAKKILGSLFEAIIFGNHEIMIF